MTCVPIPPSALGTEGLISALRSSGVGAYVWDRRKNLVRWHGYPHPAFGLSGAFQHPLSSFLRAVHPEDLQRVEQTVDQSIHTGSKWEMQYRVRWRDGSVHWILDRGEPGYGADGEVVSVSGACFEITEQVETEHALAQRRHADETAPANRFRSERIPLSEFTRFEGWTD